MLTQGKVALGAAYGLSMLGGVSVAIALALGAEALPLLLVGALIYLIAQVLIAKLSDNKLDSWLKRCVWGSDVSNRYSNSQQEMSEAPSLTGA